MKIDNTVNALKQIIDREGINYLSTNSYAVYNELLDKKQADPKTARLILITLLAGVQKENTQDMAAVSAYIQRKCCLKKSAAEDYEDNFGYLIAEFCDKYGFELISWNCEGETSDYIPDF